MRLLEANTGATWQEGEAGAGSGNAVLGWLRNQRFLLIFAPSLLGSQNSSNCTETTIKNPDPSAGRTCGIGILYIFAFGMQVEWP